MATRSKIQIDGLKQFRAQLKQVDAALPKQIRVALNEAGTIVIDTARPKIPVRTGAAKASLKLRSSQTRAAIAAGGKRAPYYPWLDFGGKVGRHNSVERPFYTDGRFVYVALKDKRPEIIEAMAKALTALAEGAGLTVE